MKARDFFNGKFAEKITQNPSLLVESGLKNKCISVEIDGPSGGLWIVSFDGEGKVALLSAAPTSDCTISMKDDTFEGMLAGKVNVPMAFIMRKIKVKGESSLAAKIGLSLQKVFLG